MSSKKSQYHTKKVAFQGKEMTLYSIDGVTWSTRPDELDLIVQRHSTEQAAFTSDLKGEEREKVEKVKPKHKKFARVHNDDEIDEIIEEDSIEDIDADLPLDDEVDLDVDETPIPKGKKEVPKAKELPMKAESSKPKKIEKTAAKVKDAPKASKAKNVKATVKKPSKPTKAPKAKAPAKGKKTVPAKKKK